MPKLRSSEDSFVIGRSQFADVRYLHFPRSGTLSIPVNGNRLFGSKLEHLLKFCAYEEKRKDTGTANSRKYFASEICDRELCRFCAEILSLPLVRTRLDKRFAIVPSKFKQMQNLKVGGRESIIREVFSFKHESMCIADKTMHGDKKRFNCDVYDMKLSNSSDILEHKVDHSGEKLKNFRDQFTHIQNHTVKNPNICTVCEFRFIQPVDLRTHLEQHITRRLSF